MTDYTQPADVIKRVRFFDGQFLQDQDFVDEQKYHLDRERRLGRLLGFAGIADGLGVRAVASAPYTVTVAAGTAVDTMGRQLVLPALVTLALAPADFAQRQGISVVIGYREVTTDLAQTGSKNERRFDETPVVAAISPEQAMAVAPAGAALQIDPAAVQLATLSVSDSGIVTVTQTVATAAGLRVLGAVGVGTDQPVSKLEIAGGGGTSVDLTVNGRLRSNNDEGGLWINQDRFVGGFSSQLGLFTGGAWALSVTKDGNVGIGTGTAGPSNAEGWNRVVDVFGAKHSRLRTRTVLVRAFFGAHDTGGFGASGGLLTGTESNHPLSLITSGVSRLTVGADGTVGIGGNVGIGVATPENGEGWDRAFEVSAGAGDTAKLTVRTGKVEGRMMAHDTGFYGSEPGLVIGTQTNNAVSLATSRTTRLTVKADGTVGITGNVGIGVASPENGEGWGRAVEISSGTGSSAKLTLRTSKVEARIMAHDTAFYGSGIGMIIGTGTANGVHLATNKATRLAITGTGSVGIGTLTPASTLEIAGAGKSTVDLTISSRIQSNSTDGGMLIGTDRFVGGLNTDQIGFWAGKQWALIVDKAGNVGIGGQGADNRDGWNRVLDVLGTGHARLQVRTATIAATFGSHDRGAYSAPGGTVVGTTSAHPLSLVTNGAARLTITVDGAIGIGELKPESPLTVIGKGDYSTDITIGYRMKSRNPEGGIILGQHDEALIGGAPGRRIGLWQESIGWGLTMDTHGAVILGDGVNPGPHALYVGKGGSVYAEGTIWAGGGLRYWWGPDNCWMDVQHAGGNGIYSARTNAPSDARLKTQLQPIAGALATVRLLNGTRFRWGPEGIGYLSRDIEHTYPAGPGGSDAEQEAGRATLRAQRQADLGGDQLGLIAQDVERVLPELVTIDPAGYRQINYGHLTAVLIEAIKEQQTSIDELRALVRPLTSTH